MTTPLRAPAARPGQLPLPKPEQPDYTPGGGIDMSHRTRATDCFPDDDGAPKDIGPTPPWGPGEPPWVIADRARELLEKYGTGALAGIVELIKGMRPAAGSSAGTTVSAPPADVGGR